jgi:hypothetical protein
MLATGVILLFYDAVKFSYMHNYDLVGSSGKLICC